MSTAPIQLGNPPDMDAALSRFLGVATGQQPVPTPEGATPSPEDTKLAQFVTSLRTRSESELSFQRQRWAWNDAMIAGSQWQGIDTTTGRLGPLPVQRGRPRFTANVMKKWAVTTEARLQSAHPQIIVKSGSSDDKVIQASRVATRVAQEYEWQACKMDEVLSEYIPGLNRHGDAALKVEWNPRAGTYLGKKPKPLRGADGRRVQAVAPQPVIDPMTGQPVFDEAGMPLTEQAPQFEQDGVTPVWEPELDAAGMPIMLDDWTGRNETYYLSSADFYLDPAACRFEDAMWVLISIARSPAWIFDRYGVEVQVQGPRSPMFDSRMFNRFQRMAQIPLTTQVDELWIKKGRYRYGPNVGDVQEFDKGFVVIVSGSKVLDKGPNPYNHGEFPICFGRAILVDKQMRGDTPVNDERELQIGINKVLSGYALNLDMAGDEQWLIPTTCKMPEADKRNGPGVFKRYTPDPQTPNLKPEKVPGSTPAHGFMDLFSVLKNDLGADISMQHPGGLAGGIPPQVEAGVTMEAIVERDTTPLTPIATSIGRVLERWAYLCLKNWQQFVPEERMVAVMGEWHEADSFAFSGQMVFDSFIYSVVQASVLPQSKAAEFQKAVLLATTFPQNFGWREFAARTGEDQGDVMSQPQIHAANARRENMQFERFGMIDTPPEDVQMIDDAAIHIEEHMRLLLDRKWGLEHPEAKQMLMQHVFVQHMPILQAQQAQMMAQQGAPPSGGGESSGRPSGGGEAPPPAPEPGPLQVPRPGIMAQGQ